MRSILMGKRSTSMRPCWAAAGAAMLTSTKAVSKERINPPQQVTTYIWYCLSFHRLLIVLPFFVPSHLDGFKLWFIGRLGVIVKTVELEDTLAEVCKADSQGVDVRIFLIKGNADVLRADPLHGSTSWVVTAACGPVAPRSARS